MLEIPTLLLDCIQHPSSSYLAHLPSNTTGPVRRSFLLCGLINSYPKYYNDFMLVQDWNTFPVNVLERIKGMIGEERNKEDNNQVILLIFTVFSSPLNRTEGLYDRIR